MDDKDERSSSNHRCRALFKPWPSSPPSLEAPQHRHHAFSFPLPAMAVTSFVEHLCHSSPPPSNPPSTRPCHDADNSTTATLPRQCVRPSLGPHRVATMASATSLPPRLLAPWTSRPPQSRHSRAATTTACSGSHSSTVSSRAPECSRPFSSSARCYVARTPPHHSTPDHDQGHSCPASLLDEFWTATRGE